MSGVKASMRGAEGSMSGVKASVRGAEGSMSGAEPFVSGAEASMSGAPLRILHVIAGLDQGGAEAVLARLVGVGDPGLRHQIVSLTDDGYYGDRLRQAGVPVHALGMRRGHLSLRAFLALRRLIAAQRPDVVQTWMYHADLVGGLAARLAGVRAVAWNIRNSGAGLNKSSATAGRVMRLCAWLSRCVPAAVVCCAEEAALRHKEAGYGGPAMVVIPNGCDLARYQPDAAARQRQRAAWGLPQDVPLLGCVGRWDPQKDHDNLLQALALLRADDAPSDMRCVLVGQGMNASNVPLAAAIRHLGLEPCVMLAGVSDDVPAVMNALDVHVLPSAADAFPNVVVEAMACGTPCVVTDVGDAAFIVGAAGRVAPPENPHALAAAIKASLNDVMARGRDTSGAAGRLRAVQVFSLDRMAGAYAQLWRGLAGRRA
jgi:glycosyltransferase involved in cell wall biosynthesis